MLLDMIELIGVLCERFHVHSDQYLYGIYPKDLKFTVLNGSFSTVLVHMTKGQFTESRLTERHMTKRS
jgi:hypothetical protein